MNITILFVHICAVAFLVYAFSKDFEDGLCLAVFLVLLLPAQMYITIGEGIPKLTINRTILIVTYIYWFLNTKIDKNIRRIPFVLPIFFLIIINSISLSRSVDFDESFNKYLAFIIEEVLYYIVIVTSLKTSKGMIKMLFYISISLGLIAIIGDIKRWLSVDLLANLPPETFLPLPPGSIYSTYNHPIMLGAVLAIGIIITITLINFQLKTYKKLILRIGVLLMIACLYYTFKRGPWLAFLIGLTILGLLGSSGIRRKLVVFFIISVTVFILKPGVYESIYSLAESTVDFETLKGGSFEYRLQLWIKAYSEVNKSFERVLIGYGQGSHGVMDLAGEYKEIGTGIVRWTSFRSWDNNLACILLELGFIGLFAILYLYFIIMKKLFSNYRKLREISDGNMQNVMAAMFTSVVIYFFMQNNVLIFSPELKILVWTTIAIGVNLTNKTILNSENNSILST